LTIKYVWHKKLNVAVHRHRVMTYYLLWYHTTSSR